MVDPTSPQVTGAILAGGRSIRMGTDKAGVDLAGRPMLEWVSLALTPVASHTLVVGREQAAADTPAIPDLGERHRGPLAGLAAAVQASPGATVILVAVDQPWVRTQTLRALVDRTRGLPVVPVDEDGVRQTTCAVYPASALTDLSEELESGGSIQSLLDRVAFEAVVPSEWRRWGEDGRSWFSVDRPEDIETGLARFGPPVA